MNFGETIACSLQWRARTTSFFTMKKTRLALAMLTSTLVAIVANAAVPSDAEKLQWAQHRVEQMREVREFASGRLRERSVFRVDACASDARARIGESWLALVHRLRPDVGAPAALRDSSDAPATGMRPEDLAVFSYVVEAAVSREDGTCELRILASPSVDPGLGIDSRLKDPHLVGIRFRQDAETGRALGRAILVREEGMVREVELPEVALPTRLSPFELFPLSPQLEFSSAWVGPKLKARKVECSRAVRLDEAFEAWLATRSRSQNLDAGLRGVSTDGDDFWGRPVTWCSDSEKPWPVRWKTAFGSGLVLGFSASSVSANGRAGE